MDDKRSFEDEGKEIGDEDYIFEHDELIERFLENPDAIIADAAYRFILKVTSGYITDDSKAAIEEIIRGIATDYECPLHGIEVTNDRIEIKVEVSVNETPLESAERFQKGLEQAGVETELLYIGTLGKK